MQRDTMIQWLSDLAEEARQYTQVYHAWLEAGRAGNPVKRRLLERNMMDKQAQLEIFRRMGALSYDGAQEEEPQQVPADLLLYNEIENLAVYQALVQKAGDSPDGRMLLIKQLQIIQRLEAYQI